MAKTIKVGDKTVPFDDSEAITAHTDVFTEEAALDGIVYLGLGHLISELDIDSYEVKGDVHLRMSIAMAERVNIVLTRLIEKSKQQTAELARRKKTAN